MGNQAVPFSSLGAGVTVAATAASVSGTLPGVGGDAVLVQNEGAVNVHVRVGPAATIGAAVLTDTVVEAGLTRVLSIPLSPLVSGGSNAIPAIDTAAAIGEAAGPTNVYFQRGSGGV